MSPSNIFIGIDVQAGRRLVLCAVSPQGQIVWSEACRFDDFSNALDRVQRRTATRNWIFGIHAKRALLREPRAWAWREDGWVAGPRSLRGRHSEAVLKALGLANLSWTPLESEAGALVKSGTEVFRLAEEAAGPDLVLEVVPAASRAQFVRQADLHVPFRGMFRRPRTSTPRDRAELVAFTAAWTTALFVSGEGVAVGGGDGLGQIIVPGRLERCPPALLEYPAMKPAASTEAWQLSATR